MTQLPYSNPDPGTPETPNLFGVALLAGRVTGTIVGRDGHITINAVCKAKIDGKWKNVEYSDAFAVYLTVPSAEGGWADKVGVWYPKDSGGKWAGHWFDDRDATDPRRIAAARYLLDVAFGEKAGTHILLADRCLRCSKEITHPDSIGTGFGPECIKKVGAFMPNRSGTDAGAHTPKAKDTAPADVEPQPTLPDGKPYGEARKPMLEAIASMTDEQLATCLEESREKGAKPCADACRAEQRRRLLGELSDDELHNAMQKAGARGDMERVERYAAELTRRDPHAAKDAEHAAYETHNDRFVTREADETGLRFVLTLGADPAALLAAADEPSTPAPRDDVDRYTNTEADAALFERHRSEYDRAEELADQRADAEYDAHN